jgi:hypothetical protein
MKQGLLALGVLLAFAFLRASSAEPDAKREAWVQVWTEKGRWLLRVDGGPPKQEPGPAPKQDERWKHIPSVKPGTYGILSPDGKRMLYADDDPETRGKGKKFDDARNRIMIADSEGKNPKQVLTGLKWNQNFRVSPDGKTVVCGAEQSGKWDLYRVPFDGSAPVKLSQTSGVDCPNFRFLADGRYLYGPVTGFHNEMIQFGTWTIGKGPVILLDGKKETVLLKEVIGELPEVTQDATKMAQALKNKKGEEVIEITDLKTETKEEIPLSKFNKDWTCRFDKLMFSPDGKALAVSFFLGNVVIRPGGAIAGDEAVEHVGIVWLDGRKERIALFRIDQPGREKAVFPSVQRIEWAPPAKK